MDMHDLLKPVRRCKLRVFLHFVQDRRDFGLQSAEPLSVNAAHHSANSTLQLEPPCTGAV